MDRTRAPESITVVAVAGVLLLTGPAVGLVPVGGEPASLGGGTATVSEATFEGDPSIDRGRFGTGVVYVRPPAASVVVTDAADAPQLVYRVAVPGLSYERTATRLLGDARSGRYRLAIPDRALPADSLRNDSYEVALSVSVQSFATDETVHRRNVSVAVDR